MQDALTLSDNHFSIARYWQQGDAISHAVAYLLLAMSLLSWFILFAKAFSSWRVRRAAPALDAFWAAPTLQDGIALLTLADREGVYAPLASEALAHSAGGANLAGEMNREEQVVRVLRLQINRATHRIESGLTVLASIGATAPFVGLLGTVWGIYHALANVSTAGTVQIDKIAGPVGEALIMTGFGLVVAIPAVLAYNTLNRLNRITMSELDGFAHDLQSYFTK
ncbi:MotA/TolQ/ExbB proton channel family protein [Massilia sp. CF038]|uniref:MotA/TolQ/ExbB proton channel family protein n=1 Tax=Massilia sp. CF038 TaxID=1881045 RepID=UPI00091B4113|nr:MotA/TolQ/ExbB proton channel family protein [Massilia sp. CF038]SHH55209.1 outer membrane transport energization protein ExbB [Massilia sp. CF038]